MKYNLKLKPKEYQTLVDMMAVVMMPQKQPIPPQQALIVCLLQSLYARLHGKSLLLQSKYHISMPIAEALAFQLYWTGKPMVDIISCGLINRIIGEIDKKTKSIIF